MTRAQFISHPTRTPHALNTRTYTQMCRAHAWAFLRLDGGCDVKKRQPLVDCFNDPAHPSFLLLLSSKAGGVGLNIIGANRLVLFDPGELACVCCSPNSIQLQPSQPRECKRRCGYRGELARSKRGDGRTPVRKLHH